MNDERLLGEVGSWLKDTDTARADAERITARAMAEVPRVRQRGRWWPLPTLDDITGRRSRTQRPMGSALPSGSQPAPATRSTVVPALGFVTAGVVLGLVGGFLLAGVLTTQQGDQIGPAAPTDSPSPMTVEQVLSIARTVEVEPGVLQVIDDGIRDLASTDNIGIVTGRDGGLWLLSEDGFIRLGTEGLHAWPTGQAGSASDLEVAPDGTAWTVGAGEGGLSSIWSLVGDQWIAHEPATDFRAVEVAPDGAVWSFWQDPASEMVSLGYLAGGDRVALGEWHDSELHGGELYLTETQDIWVNGGPEFREGKPSLYRLVDGTLRREHEDTVVAADVGADGTVWFVSVNELSRLDQAGTETWALPDRMTVEWDGGSRWELLPGDAFRVSPDGSVWFALRADPGPPLPEMHCGGVARFDGMTWLGPFLPDMCVDSIASPGDGSVWLLAHDADGDDDLVSPFVITPAIEASTG